MLVGSVHRVKIFTFFTHQEHSSSRWGMRECYVKAMMTWRTEFAVPARKLYCIHSQCTVSMQCRAQVSPLISLCNLCQLLAPVTHSLSRHEWLKWSGWKRDLKKTVCVWLSVSTSIELDTFIIYPLSEKGCPWKVLFTVFSVLLLHHEFSDFIFSFYWHHCDYENKKNYCKCKANSVLSAACFDALIQYSGSSTSPAHEMTHGTPREETVPQAEWGRRTTFNWGLTESDW